MNWVSASITRMVHFSLLIFRPNSLEKSVIKEVGTSKSLTSQQDDGVVRLFSSCSLVSVGWKHRLKSVGDLLDAKL